MRLKLNIKDLFIIVLGFLLIISFVFGLNKENEIDYREQQIQILNKQNEKLFNVNDSLLTVNKKIDYQINELERSIKEYQIQLNETELQLDKLLKIRNEIPTYVNNLSANGVADELAKYITRHKINSNSSN